MEVNPSSNLKPAVNVGVNAHRSAPARPPEQTVEFPSSEALNTALKRTADSRPEEVERGRELVAQSTYPPQEMIRRISTLLAIGFSESR